MKNKNIVGCLAVFLCLFVSACSKDVAPGDYDAAEVGKIKKVVPGMIISKRPVNIHTKSTDNVAAPTDGNAAPATPPTETDNSVVRSHGYEYVIRLNSGAIISVVQTEDLRLKTKQHILVIYGNNTRVVPDDGSDDY